MVYVKIKDKKECVMNQRLKYRLRKLKVLLFIVALVLSVYGSYQVYHGTYDTIFKEIMVIIYSTFKLFTFSPTVGVTNESPLAYELAIWVAPAFTMVGFFSIFRRAHEALKFKLFHLGKKRLVLLGDNRKTKTFIKNSLDKNPEDAMILLCDFSDEVDEESYKDLKVEVVKLDFSNPKNNLNPLILEDKGVFKEGHVISFLEEPLNFTRIEALYQMTDLKDKVEVYVESEHFRMKELMEKRLDEFYHFDIHYFSTHELLVKYLLDYSGFKLNRPGSLEQFSIEPHKELNLASLSDMVGNYRLLILGYSEVTKALINQLVNLYTINPLESLDITLTTKKADLAQSFIEESRGFLRAVDLQVLPLKSTRELSSLVQEELSKGTYHGVFFASDELEQNIFTLDALADSLQDIPVAIYSGGDGRIKSMIESLKARHPRLTTFGDESKVLHRLIILEEKLYERAKAFNGEYTKVMNAQLGYDDDGLELEDAWLSLSTIKKESSIYQSAHAPTKELLIDTFSNALGLTSKELLDKWNRELLPLNYNEKVDYVRRDPFLNYLSALEHKRWNTFYYLRDFIYSPVKDEFKKTHNCLVDEWECFYEEDLKDKLFYDTLSTLMLEGDFHGNRK